MRVSEIFRSKYLKASDLQGKTITVTIRSVEVEEVGEALERKLVIYFRNNERGLVLNLTNATMLANHLGDDANEWVGHSVHLCSEPVMYQGRRVDGLRVKVPNHPPGESGLSMSGMPSKPRSPAPVTAGAEDLKDDINF
jgi:hypothetical protein